MVEREILKIIRYFGRELEESGLSVERIILFGSRAAGGGGADSDIDVAVVSSDFRGKDIFERAPMIKRAVSSTIGKFVVPLDVVTMSPDELESEASLVAGYVRRGDVVFPRRAKKTGAAKAV